MFIFPSVVSLTPKSDWSNDPSRKEGALGPLLKVKFGAATHLLIPVRPSLEEKAEMPGPRYGVKMSNAEVFPSHLHFI